MTCTREDVCQEIYKWVGVPFLHQGRSRQYGVDCVGLIWGVSAALGYAPTIRDDYKPNPRPELIEDVIDKLLIKPKRQGIENILPGDIVTFHINIPGHPQHLAWIIRNQNYLSLVHAMDANRSVCVHRLMQPWIYRYMATYCLPMMEGAEG